MIRMNCYSEYMDEIVKFTIVPLSFTITIVKKDK